MKLSIDWYKRKTAQIQAQMDAENLDGLLLLDPYNIFYATGFFHQSTERPLGCYIPVSGQPTFYVPLLEQEMAQETWVPNVKVYFDYPGLVHPLIWMLKDIPAKRLGVDQLKIRDFRLMQAVRPDFVISDLVYTMRLVKDAEEIAILEKAGVFADYMVEMAREAIIAGLSETDAFAYAREKTVERMQKDLGELVFVNAGLVNGAVLYGERSAYPHGLMTDRKPRPGDVIECGFGALVATYESESEHTFLYGEPDKQTEAYFQAMYGAWKAGMEAAKPGVKCSEVNEASLSVIREAGYEQFLRHRMGHGKGLQEHEAPWVAAGDDTILLPGMVISDEPGLYVPGFGGFRHSDTLVITETGCRRLTNYPRELETCIIPVK
ncbi:MAG TPA: aminopeptidase P family protein [Chloroflexi bacterium]|nr:aminopeptidase P family protein [Chloroflexota bacterium]